jgi:hypothetical protein
MLFLDGMYVERPRQFAPAPLSESADLQLRISAKMNTDS